MYVTENEQFNKMIGRVLTSITGLEQYSESVTLYTEHLSLEFKHEQDCCESVSLEDFEIDGDLVGGVITSIELVSHEQKESDWGSETWAFYKIETNKGGLFMRWCGSSNGYYSEEVYVKLHENIVYVNGVLQEEN